MFHMACVIGCCCLVDAELLQPFAETFVTLIDHAGNFPAFRCKIDVAGGSHRDLAGLPKILHGHTHAGLLVSHVIGYINRANDRKLFT